MVAGVFVSGSCLTAPFCSRDVAQYEILFVFGVRLDEIHKGVVLDCANHFVGQRKST
jgi:hypothetical protein